MEYRSIAIFKNVKGNKIIKTIAGCRPSVSMGDLVSDGTKTYYVKTFDIHNKAPMVKKSDGNLVQVTETHVMLVTEENIDNNMRNILRRRIGGRGRVLNLDALEEQCKAKLDRDSKHDAMPTLRPPELTQPAPTEAPVTPPEAETQDDTKDSAEEKLTEKQKKALLKKEKAAKKKADLAKAKEDNKENKEESEDE